MRKHEGTLANASTVGQNLVLTVIGERPDYAPYLSIQLPGPEPRDCIATVDHPAALRALARRILLALGESAHTDRRTP